MVAVLFLKSLGAGERWITVRPNGPGTDGHPVLIKPAADGSYHVIGGAGGALNYLKLTGVRSEGDYAKEVAEKSAARKEAQKRQKEQDKKLGLADSKAKARQAVKAELGQQRAKFLQTVADKLGWTQDEMRFPEEKYQNLSEGARDKARRAHAAKLFRRAKEAVDLARRKLLSDADARAAEALGEVPMSGEAPDQLTVQDLDPVAPATKGFGYATKYGERAEAAGLTGEALAAETAATKATPPEKAAAAAARKGMADAIAEELRTVRDPWPAVNTNATVEARDTVELLKAEKALRATEKSGRERMRDIDAAKEPVEAKAYVLEVAGAPVDADIVKGLEHDLRTIKTRAFLSEIGKTEGGGESLGRHIGVGAYNSINALALAAGGASLIDRSVVDVLGVAGAAQILARRLTTDLTPDEMDKVRQAMGRFHVSHYMAASDDALREARDWQELAHEIELGDAHTGADLAAAQELNAKRRTFVENAQRVLGTSLGEMEANAAIVVALDRPKNDQVEVSLGGTSIEAAIQQARAIGLDQGDYRIERAGASTILTVSGAGMDKLAAPVSKADLERTRGALDIMEGRADQDGWLPAGVADRPDLAMNVVPGTAPRLANPFPAAPRDMAAAVNDFVGARAADGDSPDEIMADLLAETTMQRAGNRGAFMAAVNDVAPLYAPDGKINRADAHRAAFERLADEYTDRLGVDHAPIHRQQFAIDPTAADALHRALAQHPEGVAAWKPVGDLTPQDQRALRSVFGAEYGRSDPDAEGLRAELEKLDATPDPEPARETEGLFGAAPNPEHAEWRERRQKRNELAERVNKAGMSWDKYLTIMGSPANAYAAMQDVVKSKVLRAFADTHNGLAKGKKLRVGRTPIAHDLAHLDALDPAAREARLKEHRDRVDALRNRVGGKYAAGGVKDRLDAEAAHEAGYQQSQMGMFGPVDTAGQGDGDDEAPDPRVPALGQRWTIGHAAERQIAGMMPIVGKNFRPGQPVAMWRPDMSGAYVKRQRAVKLIEHNRRQVLGMGVGSGKTSIMLSSFTDLHAKGKANRGLFLVPSVVQGQFHGEALTMLEPGKYNWHCAPGASREERIAAYKNPAYNFNVVTHQAFRDDMIHLAAARDGVEPAEVAAKLDAMPRAERAKYMRDLMQAEGMHHDALYVDEGHNLLNRAGKQNSHLANVVDGVSDVMGTYVSATADPVKNDASEAFDVLQKMDPARYADRDAFMRKYGVDTASARDGLQREMARHFYTGGIDPGVKVDRKQVSVQLDDGQRAHLKALDDAAAAGRLARLRGDVDVDAMKVLSPNSFDGVDPGQARAVAENLQNSIGIVHNSAVHHTINGGAKIGAIAKIANERRGKQGVVFAHHRDHVAAIAAQLKAEGHRVVTLTGSDSAKDKDRIKAEYKAGKHDVLVCSDAAAVGANLQTGRWLAQADTPLTAMLHAQRNGRIHRIGQNNDVELLDVVADHPAERRARARLTTKYDLRDVMTSPLEGLDDRGLAGYLNRVRAGKEEAAETVHADMPVPANDAEPAEPDQQRSMF
jgi:hypothetical protein